MPSPVPPPINEPVLSYAPGTPERAALKEALAAMANERAEIPVLAGSRTFRTKKTLNVVMPHRHSHVLAVAHEAGTDEVTGWLERSPFFRFPFRTSSPPSVPSSSFPKAGCWPDWRTRHSSRHLRRTCPRWFTIAGESDLSSR